MGIYLYRHFLLQMVGMGVIILTFGFMGFNGCSQLSFQADGDGRILSNGALNTYLSGSSAAVSIFLLHRFLPFWTGHWSFVTMANGAVCGMVPHFSRTARSVELLM